MDSIIDQVQNKYRKKQVVDVRSGDTIRVSQRIKEGNKERTQVFEGLVIRTRRTGSLTSAITVRRIASGVGVEKTFMLHSPLVEKVEVVRRSKVRRNYLSYMRERGGKSARLESVSFDKDQVNTVAEEEPEVTEEPKEAVAEVKSADEKPEAEAKEEAKPEAKEEKAPEAEAPKEETAASKPEEEATEKA